MRLPSLTFTLSTVFLAYILHSVWTIYHLYNPSPCPPTDVCLKPGWNRQTKFLFVLCTSFKSKINSVSDLDLLWHAEKFDISQVQELKLEVNLPSQTLRNGSFFLHAFLQQTSGPFRSLNAIVNDAQTSYGGGSLTKHQIPQAAAFNLLKSEQPEKSKASAKGKPKKKSTDDLPVTHWKPKLTLHVMAEPLPLHRKNLPWEITSFLKLNRNKEYQPMVYLSDLSYRIKELIPLNASQPVMHLTIQYSPISVGHLRLMVTVEEAMKNMLVFGFTDKDTDEVKSIFFDTNIYLLLITCLVSAFHLLFDFLAFKNDISFWRSKKTMVGLSFRTLGWRCISQTVVFFYLMDESTSLLVLIPSGIAAVIEMWKVSKALKLEVHFKGWRPTFDFGSSTEEEKKTQEYDTESMKYLSYLLYPLVIGGAVYSLLYTPHKSWYSWCIQSLANGVYAFGFLFMLPQLFVNYRLKSVAHLPWRAFMYKAFNTFIDDLFAFIITMPTAHRVACFRDDFVFIVYLVQRWLYPVDKKRVNEYGESYEGTEQKTKSD